jgi:hypothetical protein
MRLLLILTIAWVLTAACAWLARRAPEQLTLYPTNGIREKEAPGDTRLNEQEALNVATAADLVKEYRNAASEHGKWTLEGSAARTNAAHARLGHVLKAIVAAEEDHQLFSLYDDHDPWVQLWTAGHTLEIDEAKALSKLQALQGADIRLVSMEAEYTIRSWKEGDLRFREQGVMPGLPSKGRSTSQHVRDYLRLARNWGEASKEAKPHLANAIHDKLLALHESIVAAGDEAELLVHADDKNDSVAFCVAARLKDRDRARAIKVYRRLMKSPLPFIAISAEYILKEMHPAP